ncbi:FemAB family PEP-CTERM system-associated protein [bacterium]|nr:FemAB family PEP-CTERM system-associated protein [bacterium]RQV93788.1 MAG: FemAB family PEP-CTERM system-associated protein [bacterium]
MDKIQQQDSVQIKLYQPSFQDEWNRYILKSPDSVFGHHLGWKDVVAETYGHKPFYLMGFKDNAVVGILPLFLIKSFIFGKCLVTSPYLTFGGLVSDDEDVAAALIDQAIQIAHIEKVRYIEIRNEKPIVYSLQNKSVYCTLVLNLSLGIKKIWHSSLHPSTRRNIQKACRSGLAVVEGHDYLKYFVDINARNMHRLGTPAHDYRFFSNIIRYFPESTLLMVRFKRTFIGGMFLVYFKNTVLMPWIASLQSYFHLRPNNLLYWEAIQRADEKGYRFFDFGRSKQNSGTYRFKMQYGAKPVQLYYQYYLNSVHKIPNFDPENPVFSFPVSVWKKMPVFITKRIGHRIIRNIP